MKVRLNDISNLLKCPVNGDDIIIRDKTATSVPGLSFSITDGIIDLVAGSGSDALGKMENSYNQIAENKYDRFVSSPLIMKLLWGVNLNKAYGIYDRLYDYPDGVYLDVPCGTGLFSSQLYLSKPDSTFVAVDYSMGMLVEAKKRCKQADIRNVVFVRADVANLPFKAGSFDACFSINGFHVFPEPAEAANEIANCLKNDAILAAITVCSGKRWFSDFVLRNVMLPKGLINNMIPVSEYQSIFTRAGFQFTFEPMGAIIYANCKKL